MLHEGRGEAAEARRLLYVALTRAKEALVLCMRGKATKDNPTGLSKGCWGDVESALAGAGCCFEPGVSMFDFGGERPERRVLKLPRVRRLALMMPAVARRRVPKTLLQAKRVRLQRRALKLLALLAQCRVRKKLPQVKRARLMVM